MGRMSTTSATAATASPLCVLLFVASLVGSVLLGSDASACINVTRAELDRHVRLVQNAEAALTDGNPRRARAILESLPDVRPLLVVRDGEVRRDLDEQALSRDLALV